MGGLVRAELLRIRKRPPAVILFFAVPILVAFMFSAGYLGIYSTPPFDEAAIRAEMIANGYVEGLPPEEAEQLLTGYVESERQNHQSSLEYEAASRASYAFPRSLITILGNATIVFFALILLTAITLGDDFGSGTIRTTLLATSDRRRLLAVRLGSLVTIALLLFAALLVLGAVLPAILNVESKRLPANMPPIDLGAFAALLGGEMLASFAIVGLASMATVFVRSGALSLVVVLVYSAIEGVILTLLSRFPSFSYGENGPGRDMWLLTAFPIRGLGEIMSVAGRAASGLPAYVGEVVSRDIQSTFLPMGSLVAFAAVFVVIAFWRFNRMDIVE